MKPAILQEEVQEFIRDFDGDIATLAFKGSPFPNIPITELLEQIDGYRKTEKKLALWHRTPGIYFPKKINLEQCSSQVTAEYKASLVSGTSLADITGGFGVDVHYFASRIDKVFHFEQDEHLSLIAKHNFKVLRDANVQTQCIDGLKGIADKTFDVIYADPARRHSSKGKVFLLEDCQPDIIGNFDFIFERCHQFLLKTSPMLDISSGLQDLRWVREIHVVAVDNDVKELLWLMEKQYAGEIKIVTQNFTKETVQPFHFMWGQTIEPTYSLPKRYLYEPNAALMKAGHFGELSQKLNVDKLHQHSHLFTADHLVDMLGRTFTIEAIIPYQKRNMAPFKNTKANVTVRNFPESVATLRKKWRIKDGGQVYLFFTKDKNESLIVLRCSKMDHQP